MEIKIKKSKENILQPRVIKCDLKNRISLHFYEYRYPTHNCQVSSLSNIGNLFRYGSDSEILEIIKTVVVLNQFLIDINQIVYAHVERFKDAFVFEKEYRSTNDSNMVMILINTKIIITILKKLINDETKG